MVFTWGAICGATLSDLLSRGTPQWRVVGGLALCTMRELTLNGGLCSQESTAKRLLAPSVKGGHAGLRAGLQGRSWQLVPL